MLPGLTRSPCGGLIVSVASEACTLRVSGAVWLAAHSTLIASDLHLEKGSSYAQRGQMLPPWDSAETLRRLTEEIDALAPARVVLLGDSFHDRLALERIAPDDRARIAELANGRDWVWLEGNHDLETLAGSLDHLPGRVVSALTIGGLNLIHEPQVQPLPGEVAGHLHPAVRVSRHGRGVRRPCFVTDGRRLILPAFGSLTGGLDVRDAAIAGLFDVPPLLGALGTDQVHAIKSES